MGVLAILADFLLELALLRQLSVFNTGRGLWVLRISVPNHGRPPSDLSSRRILRLHDRSPLKQDEKALDSLLHPTGTGSLRRLYLRLEQWTQS